MSLLAGTDGGEDAMSRLRSNAAPLVALTVIAAGLAIASGAVELPDLEGALTGLSDSLGTWTYALVATLAFLETAAFVGLVAPGETAIVLGGIVAATGGVDLALILPVAWVAAALGDLASFELGRRLGRGFLLRRGPAFGLSRERMERVEVFFDQHGPKAILIGRFVGIIRAVAPFLAGASGMRLRAFLPWSLLGTAAWAAIFTVIGYVFGHSFSTAADAITRGGLAVAAVVAGIVVWRRMRARRAETASHRG